MAAFDHLAFRIDDRKIVRELSLTSASPGLMRKRLGSPARARLNGCRPLRGIAASG